MHSRSPVRSCSKKKCPVKHCAEGPVACFSVSAQTSVELFGSRTAIFQTYSYTICHPERQVQTHNMSSTRALRPTALRGLRQVAARTGATASRRPYGIAAVIRHTAQSPRRRGPVETLPSGIRRYSQQQAESKIWSFEEVRQAKSARPTPDTAPTDLCGLQVQQLAKQPQPDVVIVGTRSHYYTFVPLPSPPVSSLQS